MNSIPKEIVKAIDFQSISNEFFNGIIKMQLQNDNMLTRLNRNENSYCLKEGLLHSFMTDLLPFTQKCPSNSDNPQFSRTPQQTYMSDFSHISKVNIGNILVN